MRVSTLKNIILRGLRFFRLERRVPEGVALNQDGRRPGEGPPDLDQLWKDFNQRLGRFFGGGDGGGRKPDMRGAGAGLAVVLGIAILLWISSGFFSVQEGDTAVITTFGKFDRTTGSGFNWRWPAPIQSHEIVNMSQLRKEEVGMHGGQKNLRESLMLTDDKNIVDVQFAVQYHINDAQKWLFVNRDREETVKQVAETAMREIVGRSEMDFVLYSGREKVAIDVQNLMQEILNRYDSGVQVNQVILQDVQAPEQVQAAFNDAAKAEQDRVRQINEGQAYEKDILPKAKGTALALINEAEAYRAQVVANAEGDAARFKQVVTEYQKAPVVTRDRMYLETMQQIFSNTTKAVIDSKGNNLLYLPLDKLIAQAAALENAQKPSVTIQVPNQQTGSTPDAILQSESQRAHDARARDGREREGR